MAKAFPLVRISEHFKGDPSRVDRVIDFLKTLASKLAAPDVFALYEGEGKEVFTALTTKMPDYTFHITECPEVQWRYW